MIPYGRQWISEEDIEAVVEVLHSDFLTQGPSIDIFERAVADYCAAKHAVAVSNGTAALHLACMALGLGSEGLLWTTPITFVASANCARYIGADVDFVDIHPQTLNMDVDALAHKLKEAEAKGRIPDVVVPVHFGGASCDMKGIRALSEQYGFKVIEDASHAIGGNYLDGKVGDCRYSDATVFSFHPVKVVTTAEGGMIMTSDHAVAERVRLLRTHGITRDPSLMSGPAEGAWYYQQIELGFNYRMTDLQAALGVSQLRRVDQFVSMRNDIAAEYREAFSALPIQCQSIPDDVYSAYHLFVVQLEAVDRGVAFDALRESGLGVNVHYIPVHLQPYYRKLGFSVGDYPVAEEYYRKAVSLPLYPRMSVDDVRTVISATSRAATS